MTNLRLFTFAAACLPLSAAFAASPAACPQFFAAGELPAVLNPRLTQRTTLLCNDAFAVVASGVTHGALWSAEHLTTDGLDAARGTPRQGEFHPEGRLPQPDQAQLEDYRGSGYDRGHMAPSGDMPNEQAQQQSFSLANMVPQAGELNRGIWSEIEIAVRRLASSRGELYVVTGPAFMGQQVRSVGADGVLVPSSTWKAVYDPRANQAGVYVCSNTATPQCAVVPVATLTQATGIDPFPAVPASVKNRAMALPQPGTNRRQRRPPRSLLDQLFGR